MNKCTHEILKKHNKLTNPKATLELEISPLELERKQRLNNSYIIWYMQLHRTLGLELTPTQFYKGHKDVDTHYDD